MEPTPVEFISKPYPFWLKRDDLLDPHIGGNKGRKLHFLLHTPLPIDTLISYGSLHSNAMYSLAHIARKRRWSFIYYARFDRRAVENPAGNLKGALELGMELRPIEEFPIEERNLLSRTILHGSSLILPEGGRTEEAALGIALLAQEIRQWARGREITIFLPSGTGTTALFLQKYLPEYRVLTVPCVGGREYLQRQFSTLEPDSSCHPTILEPPRRYPFGRLSRELWEIWGEIVGGSGIEFDLLYDPVGFITLKAHNLFGEKLLYIHQGGLLGNETMIARYKAKFGTIAKTIIGE
ncbi:MAG: 1-aminocyclopropane-1-carboxylate deaminase/D-cysteine desulfhydrase [Epsilonproteobacteria bacterium]|nr:1-aminocyclopropane-1-carboxylate deaminase [Campylobacterota bacterium]NPA56845.1 1-aminocyclopropane-1-carboxylate deaminase/D-cysteine desulfhydrase [Campylobacterota bacterium]